VRSVPGLFDEDQQFSCWLSQLRFAVVRSEKLVAEARTVRELRGRGTSAVGSRYQATVTKD
jgi:hypothetical protein